MIYNMWTISCSIQISNTTWFKLTSRWNLGKPMKTWLIVREKSVKIEDILHVCSFRHKVRPCGHKTFEQSQHCIYNIHSVLIGQFWSMSSKFVLKSFMTVRLDWVVSDVYEECCIKHDFNEIDQLQWSVYLISQFGYIALIGSSRVLIVFKSILV